MKITISRPTEYEIRYLDIAVHIYCSEEHVTEGTPFLDGDDWSCIIDLDNKCVLDWPQGKSCKIDNAKICDAGTYKLLDADKKVFLEMDGCYVPNNLLPGDYGDYLSLDIDENGIITNWLSNANLSDFIEGED